MGFAALLQQESPKLTGQRAFVFLHTEETEGRRRFLFAERSITPDYRVAKIGIISQSCMREQVVLTKIAQNITEI